MQNLQTRPAISDQPARPAPALPPRRVDARPQLRPLQPVPAARSANAPEASPLLRRNLASGRIDIVLLLLPGFPLYDLSVLCDSFTAANRQAGWEIFTWRLLSADGAAVASSLGAPIAPAAAVDWQSHPDNVILLSGGEAPVPTRLPAWLRQAVARHAHIVASGAAVSVLARSGILAGKNCTAHWSAREALQEAQPDLAIKDRLYVAHDRRITCAGGKALMDFALACIATALDERSARQTADALNHDRLRPGAESQHPSPSGMRGIHNRSLLRAIEMIEANLAEPLSTEDLADEVGICPRQLQRLFKRQFGLAPGQFGMQRRMLRARQLLHQTEMSITEVGVALGFVSLSHFSRCYMRAFGRQPRHDRLRLICE